MLYIPNFWPDDTSLIESYRVQIAFLKYWREGKYDTIIHLFESMNERL